MAKSVMIVDDIEYVRKTLSQILTEAKYHVVGEADDGEKAFQLYKKLKPDLVTMDLVMPKVSGIEAIRKIMKEEKNAKIVVISAMGQENLVMEAINVGAKDYILKPFTARDVIKTLDRIVADMMAMTGRTSFGAGGY